MATDFDGAGMKLPSVRLPPWMSSGVSELIALAERLIPGTGRGPARKAWVKESLKKLLREHDLEAIPDWIEGPAEDLIVDVVVELVFSQLFRKLA